MKKLWLMITVSIFLSACGAGGIIPAGITAGAKPKVGDTVVAKWSPGSFYEGKVEKIEGSKFTIGWSDKSNSTQIDATDIYAVPAVGAKPEVQVGEMALVKNTNGPYWYGAEVVSVDGGVYNVRVVTGTTTVNLGGEKIIKVPATTAADFKQAAGSTDLMVEAKKAKPTIPADYKPKKGDAVLAEWSTNSWWAGKIDNISGSNIYIAWMDNSKPSAVNISKVMPILAYDRGCRFDGVFIDSRYFETGDAALSKNALNALGWKKAKRVQREKLAKLWVEKGLLAFYTVLETKDEDFKGNEFQPPQVVTKENGETVVTLWTSVMRRKKEFHEHEFRFSSAGKLLED